LKGHPDERQFKAAATILFSVCRVKEIVENMEEKFKVLCLGQGEAGLLGLERKAGRPRWQPTGSAAKKSEDRESG